MHRASAMGSPKLCIPVSYAGERHLVTPPIGNNKAPNGKGPGTIARPLLDAEDESGLDELCAHCLALLLGVHREARALAGVQALAGIRTTLAGALALAGVAGHALAAGGIGSR